MLVSVIVPVYNVEEYIGKCVESLIIQTYKNLEIILVDDGSTDNSRNICEEYEKKDNRIRIIHKKNGGAASARNLGVENARGNWIMFCDADDYYHNFAIEYLVKIQKRYTSDIVLTSIQGTIDGNFKIEYHLKKEDIEVAEVMLLENALEEMYYGHTFGISPCAKLYRKKVLLDNKYTEGQIHEDLDVAYKHLKDSPIICKGSLVTYSHYKRQGSISNSNFSEREMYYFEALEHNKKYLDKYFPSHTKIHSAFSYQMIVGGLQIVDLMLLSNKNKVFVTEFQKKIKKYRKNIWKNKKISLKEKIKYSLFIFNISAYKKVLRVIKK